jgi:hypothetical protein
MYIWLLGKGETFIDGLLRWEEGYCDGDGRTTLVDLLGIKV